MTEPVIIQPRESHTGTIIFLHGLGDSGHGWATTIRQIVPSYVKVICPTAPLQQVTINGGYKMTSWFDIRQLDANGDEDENGIKKSAELVNKMLDDEITKCGIPSNRIVLGGFSQGGGLTIHTSLRYPKQLAGILGLSCWLPLNKQYPAAANPANLATPLLQCHGDLDHIVPTLWGKMSTEQLKAFMQNSELKVYPGMAHSSCEEELMDVKDWLKKVLPAV